MSYLDQNIKFLKLCDEVLAQRVASDENDAPIALQATEAGPPTLVVQNADQAYALHHPEDPILQSRDFLDAIENWKKSRNIAIIGGGLCYIPFLIYQAQKRLRNLIVLEPSISVFRAAMHAVDMTPLLRDSRVRFVVGSQPGLVYNSLLPMVVELTANPLTAIEVPSISAVFPDWTKSVKQQLMEVMQFGQSGLQTKFKDGPLTLSNLFQNLPLIAESAGLSDLGESLKGVPAIIVAAGPSLQKNIEQLREVNDDFLVICTDTAFETLRRKGIKPHAVITVDPTELNLKHFPDACYDETVLLFDPEARPEIARKFSRRMTFMTDKHPFFEHIDKKLGGKGIAPKASMVSQAGLYAAHFLGCDPVILIGQDLALDPQSGHTHNPETAYCRTAQFVEDDRDHIDIPIPSGDQSISRENLFWVEGVDGKPVPTMQNFMVYIRLLEKDAHNLPLQIVDATEGGAKIKGTEITTLAEAMKTYRKSGAKVSEAFQTAHISGDDAQSRAQDLINSLKKILISRVDIARDALKQLEDSPDMSLPVINKAIESYQEKIFADPVAEYLIEYGAPRELFEFMKMGPARATDDEEQKRSLERCRILLEAVKQAADRLLEYM